MHMVEGVMTMFAYQINQLLNNPITKSRRDRRHRRNLVLPITAMSRDHGDFGDSAVSFGRICCGGEIGYRFKKRCRLTGEELVGDQTLHCGHRSVKRCRNWPNDGTVRQTWIKKLAWFSQNLVGLGKLQLTGRNGVEIGKS